MANHRFAPPKAKEPGTGLRAPVGRRKFLGYLVAAPPLVVAAEFTRQTVFAGPSASAPPIPPLPQTP